MHKRAENLGRQVDWQVARPGKRRKLQAGSDEAVGEGEGFGEGLEHPFLKKRIFDYGKVRYRGLYKMELRWGWDADGGEPTGGLPIG